MNNFHLPSISVFSQSLVSLVDQKIKLQKEIFQLKYGDIKNPKWQEAAEYKHERAKSSGEASRRESEPALISANFPFPLRKPQKNKPDFFGKIVNLFHNNMQARYPLLIKFCRRKAVKVYV